MTDATFSGNIQTTHKVQEQAYKQGIKQGTNMWCNKQDNSTRVIKILIEVQQKGRGA